MAGSLIEHVREPVRAYSLHDMPYARGRRAITRKLAPLGLGPLGGPPHAKTASTVVTFGSFFSGVVLAVQTDLGLASTSSVVTGWADQSGNGNNGAQATSGHRPTLSTGLAGFPGVLFDGVDDTLDFAGVPLAAVGTTPVFVWLVMRRATWVSNAIYCGALTSIANVILDYPSTPSLSQYNANVAGASSLAGGTWGVVEALFSNSTGDYIKAGAGAQSSGVSAGSVGASTGFQLGNCQTLTGRCGALEALACVVSLGAPTTTQRNNAKAAVTAKYGI